MPMTKEAIFTPVGKAAAELASPKKSGKKGTSLFEKAVDLPEPTTATPAKLGLKKGQLLEMFESMVLQRRFEERAMQMYQKGKFGGFLHLYIGQEAVSTGTTAALKEDDDIITAYRDHGWGLVRGISAREGMAELFGKATGCSKGKGGSMHFANVEKHFWGGYGIVGGHIPLGGGLAFANKYKGLDRVTTCFMGDGAVDQGALHETMNMAQLWKLPIMFIVENNGYAMGTATRRHSTGELWERALGYGMKHRVVNGMDVLSVYEAMKEMADEVRKDSMPWFIEIRTYRYRGHSMSDPQKYRDKDEMEEFQSLDPIERLKTVLLDKKMATQKAIDAIYEKVEEEVMDAVEFADNSPFPEESALYEDMFSEPNPVYHK